MLVSDCHFSNSALSDTKLNRSDLTGALFDNCDLRRVDLRGAVLENVVVDHTDFKGCQGMDRGMMLAAYKNYIQTGNRVPVSA